MSGVGGYEKIKSESYTNFGGINQKMSEVDLNVFEFLDISNMDLIVSGALKQRPGTATLLASTNLGLTSTYNFFYGSGGLGFGFFGITSISNGAAFFGQAIGSIYEFTNLNGTSFILFSSPSEINYNTGISGLFNSFTLSQLFYVTGNTMNFLLDPMVMAITDSDYPTNPTWDFKTFVNRVFMCNGDHFYKWDGSFGTSQVFAPYFQYRTTGTSVLVSVFPQAPNVFKYGLPPGSGLTGGLASGFTNSFPAGIATYTYSFGFVNERGYLGPVSDPITIGGITQDGSNVGLVNALLEIDPLPIPGFSLPTGYGIGATIVFDYFGTTSYPGYVNVAIYRDNGPGTGRFLIGYKGVNSPLYQTFGFIDNGLTQTNIPEPTGIFATLPPQFLEIFNNQMFMAGFSQAPSTVQFSDIGEPESVQPENNFDVRTNDGDFITGMKAAFSNLYIFKRNSFHQLSGTDPTNFVLNPISDQYGCVSHRATAVYQNQLMFLDENGIVLFNGAVPQIASTKIDPIFARMNLEAAYNQAWMVHYKDRKQIWCAIPIDGSTLLNQIIIYDYLLNAWSHYDGLFPNSGCVAFGALDHRTVYWGGYSGYLAYFGTSFPSDMGNAISMMWQGRYVSDLGQSVEKMWRRLFLNNLTANGATNLWLVSLYANYASLPSQTFIQGGMSFQSLSNFGISAKALSVRTQTSTSTDFLVFQGFTIESRYQRNS